MQPNQGDKNLATLRRSSKSRLSLNPLGSSNNSQTITHEAMASPPAEPEVIKKYDEWGREILIKNHRNGKYEITAGTLQTLVESLAEEASPDTIYIEVFLLTFRHFMTPVQLLSLLQKRFRFQSETPNVASIIRVRVMSVLKKWVERHEYDFQTVEMQDLSKEFLLEASTTDVGKYALSIRNLIDSDANQRKYAELRTSDTPLSIRKVYDTIDFLTSWTPKKIAIELTLNGN